MSVYFKFIFSMKRKLLKRTKRTKLKDGDSIPLASSEAVAEFQSGLISIQDFMKQKRRITRAKVRFNRPESFVNITEKPDPRFSLTPEEITWFYPAANNTPNWEYSGETITSAVNADLAYLKKLLPEIVPPETYFDEEELPMLFSMDSPLKYAPIYFIRKFSKFFKIYFLKFRSNLAT
jgi:hypothetical protein